jgi:hypothetical protein
MLFGFILTRMIFTVCMIFIIGYVFGNFSKNPALKVITRVASILVIISFIATNIFLFHSGGRHRNYYHWRNDCRYDHTDSVRKGDGH